MVFKMVPVGLCIIGLLFGLNQPAVAQGSGSGSGNNYTADSLPAFKSDTNSLDPFRNAESSGSPFGGKSSAGKSDTGAGRIDSVTNMLHKRKAGISLYLGVDFMDFNGKENFASDLQSKATHDSVDVQQNYESVHLAFPIGIQAVFPISDYLDLVAKTHSFWYKQSAILVRRKSKTHAGDEWYAVQGNLAGFGMRYSLPPALLSVSDKLGLYMQGLWYWNIGNTEIYSPYGNARARFNPSGSGYELQFGFQQAITKPWALTGAIGFIHQEFKSNAAWSSLLINSPPSGLVNWESSAIQVNLNLWYYFGLKP